jgi:hypothetical protein
MIILGMKGMSRILRECFERESGWSSNAQCPRGHEAYSCPSRTARTFRMRSFIGIGL